MKRLIVICSWGLMLAGIARAQEGDEDRGEGGERLENLRAQVAELRERVDRGRSEALDRVREWLRKREGEWRAVFGKVEPLGQTVRLEFSFDPSELPKTSVTTATTRYSLESHAEQAGQMFHIEINGSLKKTDRPDGSILLTYDAAIEIEKEEESSQSLHASGSILAALGKSVSLASVGQYTLKVVVQPVKPGE